MSLILESQRISEFLKVLGQEKHWREFFKEYITSVTGEKTGIIIDSTGMPNEIDFPLSAWGNHGGESEMETRLMLVVDKTSGKPLYFDVIFILHLSLIIIIPSICGNVWYQPFVISRFLYISWHCAYIHIISVYR